MQSIKRFCFDGNIKYYGTDIDVMIPKVYEEKDQETRGVWVSTVANIDIPKIGEVNEENIKKYKEYLDSIINTLNEYKMNTVIFQVRPVNDALYESKLNPWSSVITGEEGKYPGFDVLEYFCKIAKENEISVHAWINPYRAGRDDIEKLGITREEFISKLSPESFAYKHPECTVLTNQNKLSLDPTNEKVREFIVDTVIEIATKYDVKAIHIDDYFYPYEGIKDPLEEEKCKAAGFDNIDDFRRDNVNKLIEMISKALKSLDKKVEFGISPFGIYRTASRLFKEEDKKKSVWEYGSNNHPSCITCYSGLFADVYYWMEQGWIDYVVPQNYWDLDNTKLDEEGNEKCVVRYADIAQWWSWAAEKTNVKLYMGQAMYRYSNEGSWANPMEIPNQLLYNQTLLNNSGTIFFTYHDMVRNDVEAKNKGREVLKTMWTKKVKDI